jgi:hypothetical protein
MRAFQSEHAGGFHVSKAEEAWTAYVGDWSRMDALYRRLIASAAEAETCHADAPGRLRDALDELCEWADDLYVNWFLRDSTSCWVGCAERQWRDIGHVRGVPRQDDFWDDVVQRELSGAKRVAVVVSDAMRYEVGAELAGRLSAETKAAVETSSMQAAFPSVTEFGMASLLPHTRLELRPEEGSWPYVAGVRSGETEGREAILRAAEPRSRAIQARELVKSKRAERRELVGDARVVYVYHNLIDSTGEEYPTEDRVLGACSDAVDDLAALSAYDAALWGGRSPVRLVPLEICYHKGEKMSTLLGEKTPNLSFNNSYIPRTRKIILPRALTKRHLFAIIKANTLFP